MSEYTAPKLRSYKDATAALTGVYATDTTYGDKLNSIIEQYQLTIYLTHIRVKKDKKKYEPEPSETHCN